MISVTITDRSGRTLSGQTVEAFWISIAHARPFSVGINCALGAKDMAPYIEELSKVAPTRISCYPNAGLPNQFGAYDELPAQTAALLEDFAPTRLGQHRRRLLRHDAGSHRGDRGGRRASASRRLSERSRRLPTFGAYRTWIDFCGRFSGLEPLTIRPDIELPDDRRADQRHRLGEIRAPDQGRRLRDGRGGRARPGARRREHPRRQHGRRHARLRAGDDDVSELPGDRAGSRARAVHGRQLEVVGHRGRAQVRPGQAHRQLDQPEGRRGRLPRQGALDPPLRRRRDRDGLRRTGTGRDGRAQGRRSASGRSGC